MNEYSLSHLNDRALLSALTSLVAQDRTSTAVLLAHIAEVDARKLYVTEGYSSMYVYCVEALKLSEDAAFKRITAGRCARQHPRIFSIVAEGRLTLSSILLLARHLTSRNADDLLTEAAGKRKSEVEVLLAERYPTTELLPMIEVVLSDGARSTQEHVEPPSFSAHPPLAPERVGGPALVSRMKPIAKERFTIHVTVDQSTHDMIRRAQDMLSHRIPNRDLAEVLQRVIHLGVRQLEKRKFGVLDPPH